jgi:hypothetical protein
MIASSNVIANVVPFHPDYRGDTFLRKVGSHKSHTESHPRIRHFSMMYITCVYKQFMPIARDSMTAYEAVISISLQ